VSQCSSFSAAHVEVGNGILDGGISEQVFDVALEMVLGRDEARVIGAVGKRLAAPHEGVHQFVLFCGLAFQARG
ncbi:hypothetical protein, partial [Staphylococcus aureus]